MKHLAAWQRRGVSRHQRGPVRWRERPKRGVIAPVRLLWSRQRGEGNRLLHMMLPGIVPAPEAGRWKDGRRAVCQQASEPSRLGWNGAPAALVTRCVPMKIVVDEKYAPCGGAVCGIW